VESLALAEIGSVPFSAAHPHRGLPAGGRRRDGCGGVALLL